MQEEMDLQIQAQQYADEVTVWDESKSDDENFNVLMEAHDRKLVELRATKKQEVAGAKA